MTIQVNVMLSTCRVVHIEMAISTKANIASATSRRRTDVLIIGGGVIGLMTAYFFLVFLLVGDLQ
jgi:hypothetical protein